VSTDGVFVHSGRYLGSRPAVWLAGIAVNVVILLVGRQWESELAYLAAAATGVACILAVWAIDTLLVREPAVTRPLPRAGLRRLAAVAFAVGVAWALTSIMVWLVPAVEALLATLDQQASGIY